MSRKFNFNTNSRCSVLTTAPPEGVNQYNYTPYQFGSLACGDWSPGSPSRKINGVITGFFAVIDDSIVALFVLLVMRPFCAVDHEIFAPEHSRRDCTNLD